MIKVISFDIGGTLIKNEKEDKYTINNLANLLNMPYEIVREAYKQVFQKTTGTFQELVVNFCKLLNIPVTDQINNFFHQKFKTTEETISKEDIDLLKEIKQNGYKIILFSNNCCLIKTTIKNKVSGIVDEIFYSFDLGYTKSDDESYKYIENKMGYKSNEFLHIGDTLKSDYLKPKSNGWNALYYGNTDDESIEHIDNLHSVLKYIRKKY